MSVSFRQVHGSTRLINPMKGFTPDKIPYEIRFDPLTGETARVFDFPFRADMPDLEATVRRSREIFCPFCPENIDRSTPLFPEDLIPEGRIKVGEATLIPNLVPFDKYAGVSILSRAHYVPMEDLTPETMNDAFLAAFVFIRKIARKDPLVRYFSINWNYMPPAGSSMVHPHLQPNCGEVPTNEQRRRLEGCNSYTEKTGRGFWSDLVKEEKDLGVRYIGDIGPTSWIMSFVPLGFLPDVCCIFPGHTSMTDMGRDELTPFLTGLASVLRCFQSQNIHSFNLSVFSGRQSDPLCTYARICPRLLPRAIGNSDMAYPQTMHKEPFSVRRPETVCEEIRGFFPPQGP